MTLIIAAGALFLLDSDNAADVLKFALITISGGHVGGKLADAIGAVGDRRGYRPVAPKTGSGKRVGPSSPERGAH